MTYTYHTPGPWRVEGILTHRVKPGHIISHGLNEYRDGPEGYVCDTLGTTYADALLIAAAPELLEACQTLATLLDTDDWFTTGRLAVEQARAAIAKATGVQS
jgi:hypothetical protein